MTGAFDNRLVSLGVQPLNPDGTPDGSPYSFDQSYYILATGSKYTDGSLGECALRIDNIAKKTRDYLVSKCSPWVRPRGYVNLTLDVGRQSTGTFRLFEGQATAGNPTQPPDIGLTFTSLTNSALLGNIGTLNTGPTSPLKNIATQIAAQLPNTVTGKPGIPLDYIATYNPTVNNYSFTGPLIRQVDRLNAIGGVNAAIVDNVLVVVDAGSSRNNDPIILNASTGMIGVPVTTELGVSARALIGREIRPFDRVTVQSTVNPGANGTFFVYKLGYDIASRATPFYWNLEMRAQALGAGVQ